MNLTIQGGDDYSVFKDSDSVSAYASQAVSWAVEKGIVSGNDEGKIEAGKNATRAESAKIIHHFLGVREM